MKGSRLQENCH